MPNHVRTVVKFKTPKEEDKNIIIEMIARKLETKDDMFSPDHPDYIIDFDKIIPEPRFEEDCDEDCKRTDDSYIADDEERPWFDWYKWRNKYWGTKWNAYDGYTIDEPNSLTFVFNTAWSIAEPVLRELDLLGYDIDIKYADEDLGCNCGEMKYRVNNCSSWDSGWSYKNEDDYKDPVGFARRLWDKY